MNCCGKDRKRPSYIDILFYKIDLTSQLMGGFLFLGMC